MGCIKYLSTTLKQYKECYSDLLERHKLEYADHNEFTFINSELESFRDKFIGLDDVEEFPFQFQFITGYTDEELSNILADEREFRDIAIKSNLSCSLIIDFLDTRKQELEEESGTEPAFKTKNSKNLSIDKLALIMVYEGNTLVTRDKHGDDLYNKVTKWAKSKTRTADPDTTKLVLENKIGKFESIIPFLMEDNRQKAIDEIKTLKLHLLKY
jgi:hypothetical protein